MSTSDSRLSTETSSDAVHLEVPIIGLSAPSAAGKTWLARRLLQEGLVVGVPSWTTRGQRPDEVSTEYDHTFVSQDLFDEHRRRAGFVLEASLYGHDYGLSRDDIARKVGDKALLVLIKPQVIGAFRAAFGDAARVCGLEAADGIERVGEVMLARGQTQADIDNRVAEYMDEQTLNAQLVPPGQLVTYGGHPESAYAPLVNIVADLSQ